MANQTRSRHPMTAWWIGLAVILAAVAYVAYQFACLECRPAGFLEFMILGIMPAVYLVLMYVTLKGQSDSERR
ncbi:hypothetical protein [Aurantimonas marina]|uniref:hypothetical protein n=1 Tax=Aurantimonas marina TaxID=2780508 RepID=UPI0019D0B96E|nr:hypothetical protein [Aurantimonas marina]